MPRADVNLAANIAYSRQLISTPRLVNFSTFFLVFPVCAHRGTRMHTTIHTCTHARKHTLAGERKHLALDVDSAGAIGLPHQLQSFSMSVNSVHLEPAQDHSTHFIIAHRCRTFVTPISRCVSALLVAGRKLTRSLDDEYVR